MPPTRLLAAVLFALTLLPVAAIASPWDGRRVMHDGADATRELPLYDVPGAFTVTWAPGLEATLAESDAVDGPQRVTVGRFVLERVTRLGAPRLHTEQYRLVAGGGTPGEVARALMTRTDIVVAAPLMKTDRSEVAPWRAVTPRVLVQLRDPFDVSAMLDFADDNGLVVDGPRGLAPDQWALSVPSGAQVDPAEVAMELHRSEITRWAAVNWIQPRAERYAPTDELYTDQWHLDNTGQAGGTAGHDINAQDAWELELGDPSVIIAILDSGVDTDHPDLAKALVAGYDFIEGDADPNPGGSSHGTSVAGVAGAPDQGLGVVGGCPGCLIMPIRMLGADDASEADAVDWAVNEGAAIINNSWGPTDGTGTYTPISAPMATAVDYAVEFGRGGLGVAIFWAGGNGYPIDTCSDDGFVSYPTTLAVAASSNLGLRSSYSELCPELDFTAPSSGGGNGTAGITTTNIGGYTGSFGGTSSASPLAAGVGGLVLSAIPDLSFEGLRELMRSTAEKIDPGDAAYDVDGHSESYGYGRVDALAALQSEVAFLTVPASIASCTSELDVTVQMPELPGLGSVLVEATSSAEVDPEAFTLTETADGLYEGTIQLTAEPAAAGDGLLSVEDGDLVTIVSVDVGASEEVSVDCNAPIITNPRIDQLQHWGALVMWDTNEEADGFADWVVSSGEDPALETVHQVWALDLVPCTDYVATLRSSDPQGNTTTVENALGWETPGDYTVIPDDAPEDADPCDPSTWDPGTGDDDDVGPDDDDTTSDEGNGGGLSDSGNGCGGSCEASAAGATKPIGGLVLLLAAVLRRRRRGFDHS